MTTRADAIADLARATGADILGTVVTVDGTGIEMVKRHLDQEEALAFAGGQYADDGLEVEGIRLTVSAIKLGYEPLVGIRMVVDGAKFTVRQVRKIGMNRRITLTRYLS